MNKKKLIEEYKALIKHHNLKSISRDDFVKWTGISKHRINSIFGNFTNFKNAAHGVKSEKVETEKTPKTEKEPKIGATFICKNENEAEAEVAGKNVRTLEDLIEACSIDTDRWEITKWVANKWEVASKNKDGVIKHSPLYQVKAWLSKKPTWDLDKLANHFISKVYDFAPSQFNFEPIKKGSKKVYEISIPDLHLGKLCWGAETGHSDYDSSIAAACYRTALEDLVSRVTPESISEIILPVGNDFFNSDSLVNSTTAGTQQDEDSRWMKTFNAGCDLISDAVSALTSKFCVRIIIVQGNHDHQRSFYLGKYLEAYFRKNPRVVIDNTPTQRKFYSFGKVLLAYTHGDKEKLNNIKSILCDEQAELWGKTKHREIHLGHFHSEEVKEFNGFIVRKLPSLVAPDAWHAAQGYTGSTRRAMGFVWDPEKGLETIHNHTILE